MKQGSPAAGGPESWAKQRMNNLLAGFVTGWEVPVVLVVTGLKKLPEFVKDAPGRSGFRGQLAVVNRVASRGGRLKL